MGDLSRDVSPCARAEFEACERHMGLFDDSEQTRLKLLGVRIRRGFVLSTVDRAFLAWCAGRARRAESRDGVAR